MEVESIKSVSNSLIYFTYLIPLIYSVITILAIYALTLLIKALKIYIKKNS
ncbi:Uncharacterised protein [[Clostridium] sordellii]|uniref:hypothetical protein n=1 Tax=Paraclostridium sordellii TaxID=1505 RepID=UPI0005E80FE0|nr:MULTISPECIES: hypothetical protein [Paeniclostridium]CEN25176.1 Uncharacterised protein [[Clostridium] sordellii] [Paeniclostridium sordellii]